MTDINPGPVPVNFIDDPKAPEFFVSDISGACLDGPNVRLTFASNRVNHETNPGPVNRVVNVRIVMSMSSAQQLSTWLYGFLQSQGLDPIPEKNKMQ